MLRHLLVCAALFVLVLSAAPAKAVAYCPPEYQSCDDGGAGTVGSENGARDGLQQYGYPYHTCSASAIAHTRCWECVWSTTKRTEICGGVRHAASCACTEDRQNYIVVDCFGTGACEYYS